jgi:hypothetical protein
MQTARLLDVAVEALMEPTGTYGDPLWVFSSTGIASWAKVNSPLHADYELRHGAQQ